MSEHPVYIVDDDESVRRSVGFMLRTSGLIVRTFASGNDFLDQVGALEPGCILLDIRMPGPSGLDVQSSLNTRSIDHPVVVMTGHGDVEVAVAVMKAGAMDFIEKPFDKEVLLGAVREGFKRLDRSDHRSCRYEAAQKRLQCLTPREYQVLEGLVSGHPNKTIGYDLGISPRTVEIHRANVMKKLEVINLSDLLRIAFAAGMGERSRPA